MFVPDFALFCMCGIVKYTRTLYISKAYDIFHTANYGLAA